MNTKTTNFDDVGFLGYLETFEKLGIPEGLERAKSHVPESLQPYIESKLFPSELTDHAEKVRVYYYYISGHKLICSQFYDRVGEYVGERSIGFIEPPEDVTMNPPGQ